MRWEGVNAVDRQKTAFSFLLFVLRAVAGCFLIAFIMPLILLARLVRFYPLQQRITQFGSQIMLLVLGLSLRREGRADPQATAYVANHTSWLDIFALFAAAPSQFVAKSEVSRWPGIGAMGKMMGTVFIERRRNKAKDHVSQLSQRIENGERLLFFPEGTSTDGQRILPFRSTLFGAFVESPCKMQAVYLRYEPHPNYSPTIYGLWGDMTFASHLVSILGLSRFGRVTVKYGPTRLTEDGITRKELAKLLENDTRALAPDQIAKQDS